MAIIGDDGVKYSFESDEMIETLEIDIENYGNVKLHAWAMYQHGAKLYYDYDFQLKEEDLEEELSLINEGDSIELVDAIDLLNYLKVQNKVS